ncbi:MAG TPA: hypothetical protein VF186_07530 [Gaiellaceae bacterium]|jgi:hypothetical protein
MAASDLSAAKQPSPDGAIYLVGSSGTALLVDETDDSITLQFSSGARPRVTVSRAFFEEGFASGLFQRLT